MHAPRTAIVIEEFGVFLDLRDRGFADVISGRLFTEDNGDLSFHFGHSLISDYTEDDWVGTHAHVTRSRDGGATWSQPEMVTMPRVRDLTKESFFWGPFFRTREGTTLYSGTHQVLDAEGGTGQHDLSMRDYTLLYARRQRGERESQMRVAEWPPGTFLGEQFLEGGLQLPSGRLVFTMWGVAVRGENWRCGVLLSDDDGRTWRFRTVGYEPDLAIRDHPPGAGYPAGFNEQTLVLTADGAIVSIIRGREKLGRGVPGGGNQDTWFFRSESRDEGETWSTPEPTDLPGTGATCGPGLALPDGSLLIGCRVPYSRTYYPLPEPGLFGLNLARSFDDGRTWTPERIIQRDPEGYAFNSHHSAMNGFFVPLSVTHTDYVFGFFGHGYQPKLQRMLRLRLRLGLKDDHSQTGLEPALAAGYPPGPFGEGPPPPDGRPPARPPMPAAPAAAAGQLPLLPSATAATAAYIPVGTSSRTRACVHASRTQSPPGRGPSAASTSALVRRRLPGAHMRIFRRGLPPALLPQWANRLLLDAEHRALSRRTIPPPSCRRALGAPPRFVFVLLQFNQFRVTQACVASIDRLTAESAVKEIVVVDNGSLDDALTDARRTLGDRGDVSIVSLGTNAGFARGNDAGYRYAQEKLRPDFIVVANNDVTYPAENTLDSIIAEYRRSSFSILGPDIVACEGGETRHQNPLGYWLKTKSDMERLIRRNQERLKGIEEGTRQLRAPGIHGQRHRDAYRREGALVLHGAAYVFSPLFLGDFDEPFDPRTFLYGEEDILALRAYRRGHRIVYAPGIFVLHHAKASTEQSDLVAYYRARYARHIDSARTYLSVLEEA